MKKLLLIAGFVSVLAIAVIIMMRGHIQKAMPPQTTSAAALTISVDKAHIAEWPDIIHATGEIAPWQEAIIGAETGGQRLTEVLADIGDTVTRGQVLARYETDTLMTQRAELQATLTQAVAVRDRSLLLSKSAAISKEEVESNVQQAAIAQARFDANELQIKHSEVTAPDDGVISARNATLGAVGVVGQELFRLFRQSRLEWRGQATAAQLPRLKAGQRITLALPDGTTAAANLRQISPALDAATRMATIYADITTGSTARAGMYAEGGISFKTHKVLAVPAKSVVIRDGRSYVFRIEGGDDAATAHIVPVTVGSSAEAETAIQSGITADDVVAADGAGFLNDGDTVRVAPETATQ